MSDDPVAREAVDEAADVRAIDVAEAADASAEALDVGDDEVVAKAAAEDVWTRGKRALLAFAHREPEASAKQDDEGVLARIRDAGKRLVG